jgi:hypothetical protein
VKSAYNGTLGDTFDPNSFGFGTRLGLSNAAMDITDALSGFTDTAARWAGWEKAPKVDIASAADVVGGYPVGQVTQSDLSQPDYFGTGYPVEQVAKAPLGGIDYTGTGYSVAPVTQSALADLSPDYGPARYETMADNGRYRVDPTIKSEVESYGEPSQVMSYAASPATDRFSSVFGLFGASPAQASIGDTVGIGEMPRVTAEPMGSIPYSPSFDDAFGMTAPKKDYTASLANTFAALDGVKDFVSNAPTIDTGMVNDRIASAFDTVQQAPVVARRTPSVSSGEDGGPTQMEGRMSSLPDSSFAVGLAPSIKAQINADYSSGKISAAPEGYGYGYTSGGGYALQPLAALQSDRYGAAFTGPGILGAISTGKDYSGALGGGIVGGLAGGLPGAVGGAVLGNGWQNGTGAGGGLGGLVSGIGTAIGSLFGGGSATPASDGRTYSDPDGVSYGGGSYKPESDGSSNSSGGSSRVICTHFYKIGRLDAALWRADLEWTIHHLSPQTVRGYHAWAIPYVRLMRRSRLAQEIMWPIAKYRAIEIAHKCGKSSKGSWIGKLVRVVFEPMCYIIGAFVRPSLAERILNEVR